MFFCFVVSARFFALSCRCKDVSLERAIVCFFGSKDYFGRKMILASSVYHKVPVPRKLSKNIIVY